MRKKAFLRVRVGSEDVYYGGGLAAWAYVMKLFGDIATELTIRHDGDEGLLRAYESVEFVAPVFAGDDLEVTGEIIAVGETSLKMTLEAKKVVQAGGKLPTSARVLDEPLVVARAIGVSVRGADQASATWILGSIPLVLLIFLLSLGRVPIKRAWHQRPKI